MKIAGLQKNSFVDYPGAIAAVVFTPGCNMNCFYCHNRSLIPLNACMNLIETYEIMEFLMNRKKLLDGVVISGGEPTLQPGLEAFIFAVKRAGFSVKLDTNGTNPKILKELIGSGSLDYVAMDIKAPFEKYGQICRTSVDTDKVQESIELLMQGKVDYEFRTTFVPQLDEGDILNIAERIRGASLYVLQQYRRPEEHGAIMAPEWNNGKERRKDRLSSEFLSAEQDSRVFSVPYSSEYIRRVARKVKNLVKRCETRGL